MIHVCEVIYHCLSLAFYLTGSSELELLTLTLKHITKKQTSRQGCMLSVTHFGLKINSI